jgi:DNA-binding MarR family transcriptional regulator/GNAT superfamily N-acetyltransferase
MHESAVEQVRRFNRVVTQRVRALDERFLDRDRPLGQSRLLWEVGEGGADVRALRARLDLDAGYLSRLLRSLEAAGLVITTPHAADARIRTVRLTAAGLAEREQLDRLSDQGAAALLEPLDDPQRERLLTAMREVERMLTASRLEIGIVDPDDDRAVRCLQAYTAELARRFAGGFDPGRSISASASELRQPAGLILLVTLDSEPAGCGAVKFHPGRPSEIKRMWIAPAARGIGAARRLLVTLEEHAATSHPLVRLETNDALSEALALYRSSGYREVAPFNSEPYADHWFEKRLTP